MALNDLWRRARNATASLLRMCLEESVIVPEMEMP